MTCKTVIIDAYTDGAGVASKWPEGRTKTVTAIVTVFEAAGLAVSEKKTETMVS